MKNEDILGYMNSCSCDPENFPCNLICWSITQENNEDLINNIYN